MCECCAHYKAACERLRGRCEALHEALRVRLVYRLTSTDPNSAPIMCCGECGWTWLRGLPESHAPGCLCAPEAGPEIDAPGEEKSRG